MHFRLNIHPCKVIIDLRSCYVRTPYGNIRVIGSDQMHVPVQPGTGIPTRLFFEILQANSQCVVLPILVKQPSDIEIKSIVPVGPIACFLSVDKNAGVAHGSVELDDHSFPLRKTGNRKTVPVPPRTDKRKSARTAIMLYGSGLSVLYDGHAVDVVLLIEGTIDGPVVRYTHRLPLAVVEPDFRCPGVVFPCKFPPFLQRNLYPALPPQKGKTGNKGDTNKYYSFHP